MSHRVARSGCIYAPSDTSPHSKVELAIRDIAANPPDTPSMPEGGLSGHAQQGSMGDVMGPGDENAKVLPAALSVAEDARAFLSRTSEVARAGLGASLGRPMGALGRLLSDGLDGVRTPNSNAGGSGSGSPSGNGAESPGAGAGPGAGRRLFSGFFGGDDEAGSGTPSRPTSGYANASWSRAFRGPSHAHEQEEADEFGAPMSDELRQGPFNSLAASAQQQAPGAPRRARRGLPGFPGHIDTSSAHAPRGGAYQDDEEDGAPPTGVQTPIDEEFSSDTPLRPHSAALRAQAGRGARLADQLADFQPSFLADTTSRAQSGQEQMLQPGPQQEREREAQDVAAQSAEISRVHLAAGVETVSHQSASASLVIVLTLARRTAQEHLPERRNGRHRNGPRKLRRRRAGFHR